MQPVYNDKDVVTASLQYTYYVRTDRDDPNRPLVISFNGGPGSASVWMHLATPAPRCSTSTKRATPCSPTA